MTEKGAGGDDGEPIYHEFSAQKNNLRGFWAENS